MPPHQHPSIQQQFVQPAAHLLEMHVGLILDRWEQAVRSQVPAAREQERLLLRNNLMAYLSTIISRLRTPVEAGVGDRAEPDEYTGIEANKIHGRLRATLPGYSVEQLVQEYIILRSTIADLVAEHGLLNEHVLEVITSVNEQAIVSAVKEFVDSLQNLRQKAVSMLMHDIRSPLNVITITAEMVKANLPEASQHVARILFNSSKIDQMVGELLDAVRLQAGQGLDLNPEPCDLTQLLRAAVESAHLAYPEAIDAKLPCHPIHGCVDAAAVCRSLENLISNAIKYGRKGDLVTLELTVVEQVARISIHNWGRPIAEQESTRIFVAFERSDDPRENYTERGWGLGLTYVKAVADGHKGSIELSSTATDGTTFTLCLPL